MSVVAFVSVGVLSVSRTSSALECADPTLLTLERIAVEKDGVATNTWPILAEDLSYSPERISIVFRSTADDDASQWSEGFAR